MSIFKPTALKNSVSLAVMTLAAYAPAASAQEQSNPLTAWEASRQTDDSDMVTTGVARGRDRLDSATSTSSIKENEISKLGAPSLADLFRNIPGIRVEGGAGEGLNSYTVRGLPLVNSGAKYLQIQEDGLPVLEFGDLENMGPDAFVRADLNLASVESIRGGSASTFASNAPGGVINLISKTGDVEGGSVQVSGGLNYDSKRIDFDYGGGLGSGWRFHVGGFYRQGEGPRETGYTATRGGQVKFNVTKQFDGGYLRVYGKVLDDKFPGYLRGPMSITGTNDEPKIGALPQFDATNDTVMSRYITEITQADASGDIVTNNLQNGYRVNAKTGGAELQFSLGDWSFTNRFRYSDMSGDSQLFDPSIQFSANVLISYFAGPGGSITYATGPRTGQAVDPATVSGNGLIALTTVSHTKINSLRNVTNDLRTSRVWEIGGGNLTTTAGLYASSQKIDRETYGAVILQDIVGGGNSALLNLTAADGTAIVRNGIYSFAAGTGPQRVNVDYEVLAPYGSFNFHKGKVAIGGSIRYDRGSVSGVRASGSGQTAIDTDRNGVIDRSEASVPFIASGASSPVDYDYDYVSYSGGINYRVAESLSVFARHSLGGRAGADALLFSPAISATTGALLDERAGHDSVRQTEVGVKFRNNGVSLNLTGFYATTRETNVQMIPDYLGIPQPTLVSRRYRTYGAEFEGAVRRGPFSLVGSLTLTGGEITAAETQALVGNKPRHQATLIYTLTPQFEVERFTIGANLLGQTSSYAQDVNLLKMPGFATVGLFAQYRPVDRLVLGVNASNLFDTRAIMAISSAAVPTSGTATARTLYGRLVSASARFFF
jgi:outer membrane receptor protein involved in Fe transport